ncbi:MAG: alanine racemase [Candidatus Schekmanbacteria bacterium]|nr:alanine racemase [Candidatus Schekmanbacteria bacterium]
MTLPTIPNENIPNAGFHPTMANIDLSALVHNLNQVKNLTGRNTKIMGIVKDDAYGHGAIPVSRALLEHGADMLGVAYFAEASQLRAAGIAAPIVLLSGVIEAEQMQQVAGLGLQPFVFSAQTAHALSDAAINQGKTVKLHIKIDTGMGRLGINPQDVLEFARVLSRLNGVEISGLASHLACGEEDLEATQRQLKIFRQVADTLKNAGFNIPCLHLANSAGIINHPQTHFNLVRPGIMLYGAYGYNPRVDLKPVMSLKSQVIFLKNVAAGTCISYGHTYRAEKESVIATVSVGYADGYNRLLSNKGQALIHGRRVSVIGRVCMDLIMLDVSAIADVKVGDEVTLIGRDGPEEITVNEVAAWTQTISYETLCMIGQRVRRVYP